MVQSGPPVDCDRCATIANHAHTAIQIAELQSRRGDRGMSAGFGNATGAERRVGVRRSHAPSSGDAVCVMRAEAL